MGSLSLTEIVVIVLVILIVFGPRRLPELARRAGELAKQVRSASSSLSESLGVEYEATVEPIRTAKREIDAIKSDLSSAVASIGAVGETPVSSDTSGRPADPAEPDAAEDP
jgi:TatA/E family protein of Tat protein translocase